MWKESSEHAVPLRTGLTTGACATACCVAAAELLFTRQTPSTVSVTLPRGKVVEFSLQEVRAQTSDCVYAAIIKDAGDDPDVTHGALVFVNLQLTATAGVEFKAGEGVGTVTRAGLVLAVGQAAINPVPRQMMTDHLRDIADQHGYAGGFEVTVGIDNGAAIALKTMNPRLGIMNGLSILGTTGIVRPFSCAAWIASIHQGIDVAKANGSLHIAASTGNTSEQAIQRHYDLPEIAMIEMGDFAGAVLKHLRKVPVERLSLCGGFGKLSKLANGHLDLHSRASAIDFSHMAAVAKGMGAGDDLLANIAEANTSMEVLALCNKAHIDIAGAICQLALQKARTIVPLSTRLEVWATDRQGRFVGQAGVA